LIKRLTERYVFRFLKTKERIFLTVWFERFIDEIPTVRTLAKEYKGKEMEVKTELVLYMRTE
jgi:hypothetical protein